MEVNIYQAKLMDDNLEIKTRVLDGLLRSHPNGLNERGWNFYSLSANLTLSSEYIIDYPGKPWYLLRFLENPHLDYVIRIRILGGVPPDHIQWSKIILDAEVIKFILPTLKQDRTLRDRVTNNHHWNLEAIILVHQEKIFNGDEWRTLQKRVSTQIIRWLMDNDKPLISIYHISTNPNLDSQLVDEILRDYPQYISELLRAGHLSDGQRIDLIKNLEIDISEYLCWILRNAKTSEVFRTLIECRPVEVRFIRFADLQQSKLDSTCVRWLLTNMLIDFNGLSHLSGVDSGILIDTIRECKSRLITINLCNIVIRSYMITDDYIDVEVIKEIPNMDCFIPGVELIPEFPEIKWKFDLGGDNISDVVLISHIPDLTNLKLIVTRVDILAKKSIKLDYEIDDQTLSYLSNNQSILNYLRWDYLTEDTHQDLIIAYPHLPWSRDILSIRHYYPSKRLMLTKRVKHDD